MTVRFYLVPVEQSGNARGPKYFKWRFSPDGLDVRWGAFDYGLIPTMLIAADVTAGQHDTLAAQSDVTAIPADIDSTVPAQALPAVQNALEDLRIPGGWVTTNHTYREIIRTVGGLFQFAQRHHGLHNKIIMPENVTLSQTWGDLPLQARQEVRATADSLNYDYSDVTASTTIRQILKSLADQWGDQPLLLGGFEI